MIPAWEAEPDFPVTEIETIAFGAFYGASVAQKIGVANAFHGSESSAIRDVARALLNCVANARRERALGAREIATQLAKLF